MQKHGIKNSYASVQVKLHKSLDFHSLRSYTTIYVHIIIPKRDWRVTSDDDGHPQLEEIPLKNNSWRKQEQTIKMKFKQRVKVSRSTYVIFLFIIFRLSYFISVLLGFTIFETMIDSPTPRTLKEVMKQLEIHVLNTVTFAKRENSQWYTSLWSLRFSCNSFWQHCQLSR